MIKFTRWIIAFGLSMAISVYTFGFAQGFLCPKGIAP